MNKSKKARKLWWNKLSDEKKNQYIARKERERSEKPKSMEKEFLPNGAVKIWDNINQFSVYKKEMLDETGNPLPEWI